jgi:hypothetical protein
MEDDHTKIMQRSIIKNLSGKNKKKQSMTIITKMFQCYCTFHEVYETQQVYKRQVELQQDTLHFYNSI